MPLLQGVGMNRRDKQKAETFIDIMRSAEALFMERGYERTSMKQIAEHSGLTKGALYHHFDSKESLLDRLCSEHYRALREAAEPVAGDESLSCFSRIRAVLDIAKGGMAQVSFVSEYLKLRRDEGSVMLRDRVKKYDRKFFTALIGPLLREAREKGECNFSASAEMVALFIYQLEQGVNEEINRVFAEEPKSKSGALIGEIMKAQVYALSRLLNASAEEVSRLISLEESLHLYGELLKRR
jgi:AcrR family transcriptional regulator